MSQTPQTRPPRAPQRSAAARHACSIGAALALILLLAGCAGSTPAPEPESGPERRQAPPTAPATAEHPTQPETDREPPGREVVDPSHPVRYTVRRGDTLWDIAAKFLRDPWVWPEIWQVNPEIENPHRIYPGDVITLAWAGDQPRLRVARPETDEGRDTRRLTPQVRRRPVEEAIPSIPADAIRQFLNRPQLATPEQIEAAPYIVGNYEGRLISGTGNRVFAKGFPGGRPDSAQYTVVRTGDPLRDPGSDEVIAYELIYAGKATVRDPGPPARLELVDSSREILSGDRLMPPERSRTRARYLPRIPERAVEGQIIHLVDAISQVGSNQVVVVNLGERDGLEVGHVLAAEQSGGSVDDPYAERDEESRVDLPPQRVGTLMLFKVFDQVGYGLVMDATQPVRLHDSVVRP